MRASALVAAGALAVSLLVPVASSAVAPAVTRWCTGNHWGPGRVIADRERQQRVVRRALATRDREYDVKRAAVSHFGVVALVDGDLREARRELHGVRRVVSWTGHGLSYSAPQERMSVVIMGLLDAALRDVQRRLRELRDLPGRGLQAVWLHSGTVVVAWKAPVPRQVRALDGIRPDGAEVRVVARPYSWRDLETASDRLERFLDERDVIWSGLGACASDAGLELDVPSSLDELSVSRAELDEAAGMRVLVVPGAPLLPATRR